MTDLITVVIPAYNAQLTLSETLSSVRGQTHEALEIIVVNDGSTDLTLSVAEVHAALDSRIRVLTTANGGVASARNAGIAASRGRFVAPIDADDLWHPDKLRRQLAVMEAGGPEMGFVYTLFRRIDRNGLILDRIISPSTRTTFRAPTAGSPRWNDRPAPANVRASARVSDGPDARFQGAVFLQMLLHNFVGNGSSLLIRREALEAVGGYEPELRQGHAQGCEDYLLQLLIARHWLVGCVPEYLTAYRFGGTSMSADKDQMRRSHVAMLDHVRRRFPETPAADLATSEAVARAGNAVARARRLRMAGAASELSHALRLDARTGAEVAAFTAMQALRRILARQVAKLVPSPSRSKQHFLDADPTVRPKVEQRGYLQHQLDGLAARDWDYFGLGARGAASGPARSKPVRVHGPDIAGPSCRFDCAAINQETLHGQVDEPADGPGYGGRRICR